MLKNIFKIFKSDLNTVLRNPIVFGVLAVIVLIPSIYALVNIDANMNPYGSIDQLKIAVVNDDIGDLGSEIIDNLRTAGGFNWQFVNYSTGMDGLNNGDYYSMIEVPANFTSTVYSIKDGKNTEKSTINYWNNEKLNPISPRIVNTGVSTIQAQINGKISETISGIVADKLNNVGNIAINNENKFYRVKKSLNLANNIIKTASPYVKDAEVRNNLTNSTLSKNMDSFNSMIDSDTSQINSVDYDAITNLANINPDDVEFYSQSPVILNKQSLYPADNYGSTVSPFYICLSLWVGSVVALAMISTRFNKGRKYGGLSVFWGRFGLFMIINVFQSLVMISGLLYLKIQISNFPLFTLTVVGVGLCLLGIVYSLISAFGNVGKVLSIILLVLQIPATGGIYPVELMPAFFKTINDMLPMTHAINMLREVMFGVNWTAYLSNLHALVLIAGGFVLVGMFAKGPMDKVSKKLEETLEKSGLF